MLMQATKVLKKTYSVSFLGYQRSIIRGQREKGVFPLIDIY